MAHLNLKSLFSRLDKSLKQVQEDSAAVIVDSWNTLVNSCDTDAPELDFLESFNDLLAMGEGKVSVVVGFNRDLFEGPELPYYREAKNQSFSIVFEMQRNLAGFSKDVHGQMNVIMKAKT